MPISKTVDKKGSEILDPAWMRLERLFRINDHGMASYHRYLIDKFGSFGSLRLVMHAAMPHFLLFCESHRSLAADDGPSRGKWRFVLQSLETTDRFEASDEEKLDSTGRLDLWALVRGLEALNQPSRVTILTASRYISHGLNHGLAEWSRNKWRWERFGQRSRVRNSDLWQRIEHAQSFHELQCRTWRFDGASAAISAVGGSSAVRSREMSRPTNRTSQWWKPVAHVSGLVRQLVGEDAYATHLCPVK